MKKFFDCIHRQYHRLNRLSYIRLFAIVSATIVVPLLMCTVFAITLMIRQTEENFLNTTHEKNQQVATTVGAEVGNVLSVGRLIMSDRELSDALARYNSQAEPDDGIEDYIGSLLTGYEASFLHTKALTPGVALIAEDGKWFGREMTPGVFSSPQFQTVRSRLYSVNQNILWTSDAELFSTGENRHYQCVYLVLAIRDKDSLRISGCAVFQIRVSMLTNLLMSSTAGYQSVFLRTDSGQSITSVDNLELGAASEEIAALSSTQIQQNSSDKVRYQSMDYIVSDHILSRSGWHILSVSRVREQLRTEYFYLGLYGVLVILSLIGAFYLSYVSSKRFTKPIMALNHEMRRVEAGDFNVYLPVQSEDEIGELTRQFNGMVHQIKHLIELNAAEQNAKRLSDIQFLQTQINPHFLYNTLTTLRYVLATADRETADQLVLALNRLLRYTLSDSKQLVTVNRAIEWVKNYLVIANCSFPEPIDVIYDIQPEVQDRLIIKMLIQPIVENAVLHGLKRCTTRPQLMISAKLSDNYIYIRVRDNGPGFDTTKIKQLSEKTERTSIGIDNVDRRVKLYYGVEYGLEYFSVWQGEHTGTEVLIKLPLLHGREEGGVLNENLDR